MAARKNSAKPLEWVADVVQVTDDTVTNGRIELGLRDDEIAEVWQIDSMIDVANVPDAANDDIYAEVAISMDPDVASDPNEPVTLEDLETITSHHLHLQQEMGAAGTATMKNSESKVQYFNPPVYVGTDMGQAVKGDATIACAFYTRVYFTRRRANASELNQILLKRR